MGVGHVMIETPTMTEVEQLRQLCSRQENQIEVQEERLEEGTRDLQQGRLALQKANQATESAKNELMEINSHLEQAALCAQEMASNAAMANAAKSEFLASMSHEIRTPMNGEILGQRIKEDPDLKDTSLVMLTSVGQRGEADRFSAIGFAAYLVKPVRRLQLKEVLSTVWGVSQKGLNSQMVTRHTLAELSSDEHSEVTNQPAGQVAHVLVAEDNIVNQKVASLILEKLGCKVDLVNNGQEALDAVRVNDYSLVFMDCQMPVLDGFETTKALRASEDAKIPIIAMTANALRGDRERCLNVGMDDYISKPVKAEYFESILKRWLNRTEVPISDDLVPEIKPERPYINECAIDEHVITSLRELTDDKFFIENLFIAYIEDAQKRLIGLKTAAKEGDYDQLNMTAHAMKVASQNIGARRMSELCLKLEHCPESESNQEVLFLVGCVEEELGEIIEVYPQMLLS